MAEEAQELKVHCPHCGAVLNVPQGSSGCRARCLICRKVFVVPDEQKLLEETYSAWIEEEVEREISERDYHHRKRLANDEYFMQRGRSRAKGEEPAGDAPAQGDPARASQPAGATPRADPAAESPTGIGDEPSDPAQAPPGGAPALPSQRAGPTKAGPESKAGSEPKPAGGKVGSIVYRAPPPTSYAGANPIAIPGHEPAKPAPPKPPPVRVSHSTRSSLGPPPDASAAVPIARPRGRYPAELERPSPSPHLRVVACDLNGVEFAFDARWLAHRGFRLSMPERCLFSGESDHSRLVVRPLLFHDRCGGKDPDGLAESVQKGILPEQSVADLVDLAGEVPFAPPPFNQFLACFASPPYRDKFVHGKAVEHADGVTCHILMPHGEVALEWLRNVNGVCGADYQLLRHDIIHLLADAVPDLTLERLTVWCELQPLERIRLYLRDADMLSKEDGLGGIVVTDRRVIYRKQRKRGEFKLDDYAALIAREEEGLLAIWHETEYERTRMGKLRPEQWDSLCKQLKDAPNLNILRR